MGLLTSFGIARVWLLTGRAQQIPPDRGALKEEEKDAEEPDDDGLDRLVGQLAVDVAHL